MACASRCGFSVASSHLEGGKAGMVRRSCSADGETVDLGHFRGKVVLLNYWATWCPPCVREMPSLNRLAAEMEGDGLAVVPVAIDRAGLASVIPFYRDHGLDRHLPGPRSTYRLSLRWQSEQRRVRALRSADQLPRRSAGQGQGLHRWRRRLGLRGGKGPAPLLPAATRMNPPGREDAKAPPSGRLQ